MKRLDLPIFVTCLLVFLDTVFFTVIATAQDDEIQVVRLVPYSDESVRIGRSLFSMNCTSCHGHDGKAQIDFVSDATDLTNPDRWRNGNTLQDIYRSLTEGAGNDMPPFKYQFTDDKDIWHLMNWIVSKWTPEQRKNLLEQKLQRSE